MISFIKNHPYFILFFSIMVLLIFIFFLFVINIFNTFLSKIRINENKVDSGNLAVIQLYGTINSNKIFNEIFKECREKKNIKAVILHINSAGGSVSPSQEIYKEILKTSKKKPVFASISTTAASGGYYIASASNYIFSNEGSLVGSIGVIMNLYNLENLLNKIGIRSIVVKNGKYKDIGSPTRGIINEEYELLQEISSDIYFQFLRAVAYKRRISLTKLEKIANGKVYTGAQALNLNLVDKIGTLNEVITYASSKLNIVGKVKPIYVNSSINLTRVLKNMLCKIYVNLIPISFFE